MIPAMSRPPRPPLPPHLRQPHPDRLDPASPEAPEILRRHEEAMRRDEPAYTDPTTGNVVFTARFLRDRGFCCDSGCRHCPWKPR